MAGPRSLRKVLVIRFLFAVKKTGLSKSRTFLKVELSRKSLVKLFSRNWLLSLVLVVLFIIIFIVNFF